LIADWVWVAWNLRGALSWSDYLDLTRLDRACLRHFLTDHIERHNDAVDT
jgi:hypothetical protein